MMDHDDIRNIGICNVDVLRLIPDRTDEGPGQGQDRGLYDADRLGIPVVRALSGEKYPLMQKRAIRHGRTGLKS